nr:MAG TPA: hypothetical protein [Bacteriophage sp.]
MCLVYHDAYKKYRSRVYLRETEVINKYKNICLFLLTNTIVFVII